MEEIRSTFEQYCPKYRKNVIIEVRFAKGGKKVLKCARADGCGGICPYVTHLSRYHFANYPQK